MNTMRTYVKLSKARKQNLNRIFSIRKVKNQKKWTRDEDELLISLAEKYNEKHWKEISKMFVNKNSLQCFSRYKRIRPGIIKGSWKKEEDQDILRLVHRYGKAWSKISKMLNTRNGKQIRDRFINVLDPEIRKGKFTDEEDKKLVSLFQQFGPKWATISKYYPNRTADMIKNRFHSSIKKKLYGDQTIKEDVTFFNNAEQMNSQSFSFDAESKSQMQSETSRCNETTLNLNCSSNKSSLINSNNSVGNYEFRQPNEHVYSPYTQDISSDFFPQNSNCFNIDIFSSGNENKSEELYGGEVFNWNYEETSTFNWYLL